jgi:hypothetical protein
MTFIEKIFRKHKFEIVFRDSSEYFLSDNAKMVQEGKLLRFIEFKEQDGKVLTRSIYYPIANVFRITTDWEEK